MSLESLANELLFDLFDFFSSVDLFHAFNGLNGRFDNLLINYFQNRQHFDFRLISKEDLNLIRRRYLLLFVDNIISLCLSDDDTNPNEIDSFLSRIFPLHRFKNLQSISLYNIYSINKMLRILDDLQHISHLTRLNINQCQIEYVPEKILNLMNSIWSLPNLTHCYLDLSFTHQGYLIPPSIISCSIQYLSIAGVGCELDNLSLLYEHTPYLQYLSLDSWESFGDLPQLSVTSLLTTVKFNCNSSSNLILTFLRTMPYLNHLTVETKVLHMDGSKWEHILEKYLPNLKEFNLKMQFELVENDDMEQELNRLIDSYKSPFWIDQHKWFICCYWNAEDDDTIVYLYTLPYRFKHFSVNVHDNGNFIFKSTCPEDNHYLSYNRVHKLDYCYTTSQDMILSQLQFSNIRHLTLTLPYDDHFRSIVPRLDNLSSLEIRMGTWCHNDDDLVQLQALLDQAPRLYYLKFHSWSSTSSKAENKNKKNTNPTMWKMPPFSNRSVSIRYLDLRGFNHSGDCQYYNDQQCSSLVRSPLGSQCEFLLIEVEKRQNIIDLVNKMKHLRALNVRCRDRKKNDPELIKWLQPRLPSSCTIAKDSKVSDDVRLWIR